MMVELRGLGTRPRLSPPPATQLGGSAPFLARPSRGPDQRPAPYPILLARINARKENITTLTWSSLLFQLQETFPLHPSFVNTFHFFYLSLDSAGPGHTALRTGIRQKPSLSTWLYIVTIINCLLLLHLDTECGSCAKHNEAQFPTP